MIIQQAYGFVAGPYFLKLDRSKKTDEGMSSGREHRILQDSEHVGLLHDYDGDYERNGHTIRDPSQPLQDLDDELDTSPDFSRFKWNPPTWVKKVSQIINPPIIAAIIAVIFGVGIIRNIHLTIPPIQFQLTYHNLGGLSITQSFP
jgi:hypothetical protein